MRHETQLPPALQAAADWREAATGFDPAPGNAALAALAHALDRDALGRAREALSIAAAKEDATLDTVHAAWRMLDYRARAAILAGDDAPLALPVPVSASEAAMLPRPKRLLSAASRDGAVLSVGEICLLAGAGGVGKSALAGEVTLAVADPGSPNDRSRRSAGGLLDIHGGSGPVLWLAYEEAPGEIGARLAALAEATGRETAATDAVHILDMRGWPLYGPGDRHGASGLYSARPEPLDGWRAVTDAAALAPRLIVIDPMLSAYVGEGNAVAPVREFLGALAGLAREREAGVLALAHSTKAARASKTHKPDPFDPGQIAGSAAWHDGVRGALVLDYDEDPQAGPQRRLAITKANMGPSRILCPAIPRRKGGGSDWIIGFHAEEGGRGWHSPVTADSSGNGAAGTNRGGEGASGEERNPYDG